MCNTYNTTELYLSSVGLARRRRALAATEPTVAMRLNAWILPRRLQLTLSGNNGTYAADAGNLGSRVTFNVVAGTKASSLAASLKTVSASSLFSSALTLIASAENVTSVSATIDTSSIQIISLSFKKSWWALFWEYYAAVILRVIACAVALIVLTFILVGIRGYVIWRRGRKLVADEDVFLGAKEEQKVESIFRQEQSVLDHVKAKSKLKLLLSPNRSTAPLNASAAWNTAVLKAGGSGADGLNLDFEETTRVASFGDSRSATVADPTAHDVAHSPRTLSRSGALTVRSSRVPSLGYNTTSDTLDSFAATHADTSRIPGAVESPLSASLRAPPLEGRSLLIVPPSHANPEPGTRRLKGVGARALADAGRDVLARSR